MSKSKNLQKYEAKNKNFLAWYFHHRWFILWCKWFCRLVSTPQSWYNFWCAELQVFKWDNLVTLWDGLLMLAGDVCLWVFKHKDLIRFRDNVGDWLLDGLRITEFYMWNLSSFVSQITSGNRTWFKNIFVQNPISIT